MELIMSKKKGCFLLFVLWVAMEFDYQQAYVNIMSYNV